MGTTASSDGPPNAGRKIVWILGAGFSRALGGPLIGDLLAHQDQAMINGFFPGENAIVNAMFSARELFNWGKDRHYWDHAEQFLDLVEAAADEVEAANDARSSRGRVLLESMLKMAADGQGPPETALQNLVELAVATRRAVAADCSMFIRSAQAAGERWGPYTNWAGGLNENHTVVTFNYDLVPEILVDYKDPADIVTPRLRVIDLGEMSRHPDPFRLARMVGRAPVLKLHGSTNWHTEGGQFSTTRDAAVFLGKRGEVILGLPGPRKQSLSGKLLLPLWTEALRAIREADEVVFVGYRFPPTDADARQQLLGAIADSACQVRYVLGPEMSPDVLRLEQLLCFAISSRATGVRRLPPIRVPLFAEDFLSIVGQFEKTVFPD